MNIVAMGGGERSRAFDESLALSGSEHPLVLILPTACSTEPSYAKKVPLTVERFTNLGVDVAVLHEYGEHPTKDQLAHELGRASLIYTIGGNTPYMLKQLNAFDGVDALRTTLHNGTLHSGTSAGALLPFELAHSNVAQRPAEEEWDYAFLPTLGVVPGVATAHANQHDPTPQGKRTESRLEALAANFPANVTRGYGIDNSASLIITDQGMRVISEAPRANAYMLIREHSDNVAIEAIE